MVPKELKKKFENPDVDSLYPKIKFSGGKIDFREQLKDRKPSEKDKSWISFDDFLTEKRKEFIANRNSSKIIVFLPDNLYEKNLKKEFKYLELHPEKDRMNIGVINIMVYHRVIEIKRNKEEPGYSYMTTNCTFEDFNDEEFGEFLELFGLGGSCTSKINL